MKNFATALFIILIATFTLCSCSSEKSEVIKPNEVNRNKIESFNVLIDEHFGNLYESAEKRVILDMKTNDPCGVVISFKYAAGYKIYKYTEGKFKLCESSSVNPSPYIDVPEDADIYYEGALGYYYNDGGRYFSHTLSVYESIDYKDIS